MKNDNETPPPSEQASKRPPQYTIFLAVFQCDYSGQMDVFRWLISDSMYRIVYILHDHDTYTADELGASGEHIRTDGQGRKVAYHVGDRKPPHIHAVIQIPKKCTESTMKKRFGGYVNFDGCSDVHQYTRYLTHETFDSRNKYQYPRLAVKGDMDLYAKWMAFEDDVIQYLQRWNSYMQDARTIAEGMVDPNATDYYARVEDITKKTAVNMAINAGDKSLLKSIQSHAYFYSKFT